MNEPFRQPPSLRVICRLVVVVTLLAVLIPARSETAAQTTPAGSISGIVWQDRNADGVRQTDEPGLQTGIAISGPGGDLTIVSGEDGRYSFSNLVQGPYRVRLTYADGSFFLTAPARLGRGPYAVGVTLASVPLTGVDFGLYQTLSVPLYSGLAWKNAERVPNPSVAAFVGSTDCTGPGGIRPTDQDPASYQISVAAAAIIPGCGRPGDSIHFTIDGEAANETATWQAVSVPLPDPNAPPRAIPPPSLTPPAAPLLPVLPSNRIRRDLTVGRGFAWWVPMLYPVEQSIDNPDLYVEAFVGGTLCGRADRPGLPGVLLVVPSGELKPGCGFEGATVTFSVNGTPAPARATWHAGYQDYLPLNLQPPPGLVSTLAKTAPALPSASGAGFTIRPPDTGSAGLARRLLP